MDRRSWIEAATLAASGHNTQPWRFKVYDDRIEIAPDPERRLPVVDPNDREQWISLGCATENLVVAAAADGYATNVRLPTDDEEGITIVPAAAPDSEISGAATGFDAIPERQNTRSVYDGTPVPAADLETIGATPVEMGISVTLVTNGETLEGIVDLVMKGDRTQYSNQAYVDELVAWLRFNRREALRTLDGLYSGSSGNPNLPRWLGKRFVTTSYGPKQAETDAAAIRSSAGMIVIASERDDKAAWVRTGRVYERLALTLTTLEIQSAMLNQPVEVPALRPQLGELVGLGNAQPQLLMRFGYGETMPRSLRRPVDAVSTVVSQSS
mgnify:FL=1